MSDAYALGTARAISGPVARGELGEVRRLETDRGIWAVKREFEPGPPEETEACTAYHRQCWEAGIPTPEPIRAVSGAFTTDVAGTSVRTYTWVDLVDPTTALDPAAVGELLAALHAVQRPARGAVDEWFEAPIGAAEWSRVLEEARAAQAPFADRLAELLPRLLEVESLLTPMTAIQTCHLDLWSDNLRRTTGGALCIIDFDNAGPADPGRELAMVLFEFARTDDDRLRTVHEAYLAAGGPGRVTGRDSWAMTVAQLHHIGHRHLRMWLATPAGDARARSLSGIEEFLGEPLLLPRVDQMADALC